MDVRRNVITGARAAAQMVGASIRRPSPTPFNAEIGPHRRFEWITTDLAEIKLVAQSARRLAQSTSCSLR
jgi:hypothetical protein